MGATLGLSTGLGQPILRWKATEVASGSNALKQKFLRLEGLLTSSADPVPEMGALALRSSLQD